MDVENDFATILKQHLQRVKEFLPSLKPFIDQYFHDRQVQELTMIAQEKLNLSVSDGEEHSMALTVPPVFFHVSTIPVSLLKAKDWYEERCGGYLQMVMSIFEQFKEIAKWDYYCNIICGCDGGRIWLNMCVIPEDKSLESLMPLDILSAEEKEQLGL